jgi:hypothetical protein
MGKKQLPELPVAGTTENKGGWASRVDVRQGLTTLKGGAEMKRERKVSKTDIFSGLLILGIALLFFAGTAAAVQLPDPAHAGVFPCT